MFHIIFCETVRISVFGGLKYKAPRAETKGLKREEGFK